MRDPIVPQLSAEEYFSWESRQLERFELHDGFIVAFAGGLTVHDRIAFNLRTAFERAFVEPCRSFGSDVKIKAAAQTFYYADAGVVCEAYSDDLTFVERPRIVGEVLSPSTKSYDLVDKRRAYRAMPSLEAYVIAHATQRRVEIDERRGGEWQTRVVDQGEAFVLEGILSLEDVYARTDVL